MKLSIIERSEVTLDGAKHRMFEAAHAIDPLKTLRENPLTTAGVGLVTGFLLGTREHPAVIKTLRLSMSAVCLLKPALLAAGKVAAKHAATKVAEQQLGVPEQKS